MQKMHVKKIRVWDLPIRLFHWAVVLLIVISVVTANIGGNAMEWHFLSGFTILTLVLFRILWGLVGSRYARFSTLFHTPSSILAYLRDVDSAKNARGEGYHGHNPLGSLSVLALLGVILLQAMSGLFANDDIASEGPLVKFISKEFSDQITWYHKVIGAKLIYFLVGLHVAAIAYYTFRKKENLVKPMLTGDKVTEVNAPAAIDSWGTRFFAMVLLSACAAVVYFLIRLKP
ncbi:MAG: cytochrome [Herminiimonas sp.]|nr:cytochrome [Herminiimonas sp.]